MNNKSILNNDSFNSNTPLKTVIVSIYESLAALKDEWDELLLNSRACTVFLTWEWIEAWWRTYGKSRKLFVILVRNHFNELVGIAPFYLELRKLSGLLSINIVRFLGIGGDVAPNYLDIIAVNGMEREVVKTVVDKLEHSISSWDILELADIPERSIALTHLEQEITKREWRFEKEQYSACPYIVLPKSWDEYLKRKSKNFRKKTKEHLRIMARDFAVDFCQIKEVKELPFKMELLKNLHNNRWNNQSGGFRSKEYIKFHKIVAQRFLENGWLRLYFLVVDGEEVGVLYCYSFSGVLSFYQSGRLRKWSHYSVGMVMFARAIQEAIKEGLNEFDFLCGNEPYKLRWADQQRENILFRIGPDSFKVRFIFLKMRTVKQARKVAKKMLPVGLVDWIKRRGS